MIGKTMHNENVRATCGYVMREGAIYLGGNALGMTSRELTREFAMLQALKPGLKKPVVHIVGAFAPGDRLTDDEMYEIACRAIDEQGYKHSLFTIWRHLDGTTDHFHVVTSQIDTSGKAISQSFERFRMKRTCRKLEREFGLQLVPNISQKEPESSPRPPLTPEPDGLDIELPSITTVVREAFACELREVLPTCKTFGDLAQALSLRGMVMVPQIHSENGEVYGMGYRMERGPLAGSYITGSKVPGNFSAAKLVGKHGLSFDSERDLPLIHDPKPKPPAVAPAAPKVPKLRRKKKGDRKNAKRQRKTPRLHSAPGLSPWLPAISSLEAFAFNGRAPQGARLGQSFLGHPGGWSPRATPHKQSVFPATGVSPRWMARGH